MEVILENEVMGRAVVSSGVFTGKKEVLELPDGDKIQLVGGDLFVTNKKCFQMRLIFM